jgi:agmatine deiminase
VLKNSRDAKGREFMVHKMPIPGPLFATEEECAGVDQVVGSQERDPSVRLAGSYVNFLIVNGGIIAPSFDDPPMRRPERSWPRSSRITKW